jgi:DNA-binding transcriptional regulator WhiA
MDTELSKKIEKSIELYRNGLSAIKVREITGIDKNCLYRHLKKSNLTRSNKQNSRKFSVNHDFFNVIDSEIKAYWLGFMYADGYVISNPKIPNFGLSLSSKDRDHLELFKTHLEATYSIKTYNSKGGHGYKSVEYCRLLITSENNRKNLIEKGVLPQKTLSLTFPSSEVVPNHLMNHFIRGYFDGDGSWVLNSSTKQIVFAICGTSEFLNTMLSTIGMPNKKLHRRHKNDKNNWQCQVGGKHQIKKIGDFLYRDATVYLPRKYGRYTEFVRYFFGSEAGVGAEVGAVVGCGEG